MSQSALEATINAAFDAIGSISTSTQGEVREAGRRPLKGIGEVPVWRLAAVS